MPSQFRLLLLLFAVMGPCFFGWSQPENGLQQAIRTLQSDPIMAHASWSFTALDVVSGSLLGAFDPDRTLPTASTLKLVTTATALAVLGTEFRFQTRLEIDGEVRDGILFGNVYLVGDGDPSLGSGRFAGTRADELLIQWTDALQAKGIRAIHGAIIGDGSLFSSHNTPGSWGWEDIGNYYGAGVSGLNFLENAYELHLRPGPKAGAPVAILRTEPYVPGLQFINDLLTGAPGSGDQGFIFGAPYTYLRYVRGAVPAGVSFFSIKGSLPDPCLYAAQRLHAELIKCGVSIEGEAVTVRELALRSPYLPSRTTLVHTTYSPVLRELVAQTNQKSLNVYAEAFFRRTAIAQREPGETERAARVQADYWAQKGLSAKGVRFADGSGLSPDNSLPSRWMADFLRKCTKEPWFDAFYESLAIAGRTGTLSSMLKGTRAEGNLRAKSGYIQGVRAYAGYVRTRSGKLVAFSVCATRYDGSASEMRRKLEHLLAAIAELP